MFKAACVLLLAHLFAPALLAAQRAVPWVDLDAFTFDVIAIHPDPPGTGGMARVLWTNAGYEASHVTAKELLREAYGVEDIQIQNEPRWMDSQSFTVEAGVGESTMKQIEALSGAAQGQARTHMLQALLAERFHLVVTTGVRQLPVYELTYAKEAPGLRKAKAGAESRDDVRQFDNSPLTPHAVYYEFIAGRIRMNGREASLDQLVDRLNQKLSSQLGRTFVNSTKLDGDFDFDLTFTVPWRTAFGPMESSQSAGGFDGDSADFSLFSAMKQQLGLEVKSTRGPVRTVRVEHVEQPTEN